MAKCKRCKATIPDGTEYCKNCLDKEKVKANESYLDSLLNSVKNNVPDVESIYKRKNSSNKDTSDINSIESATAELAPSENKQKSDSADFDDYNVDLSDIEDFDQYFENSEPVDSVISEEELFGESLSELFSDQDKTASVSEVAKDSVPLTKNDIQPVQPAIIEESNREEETGIDSDINELLNNLQAAPASESDNLSSAPVPEVNDITQEAITDENQEKPEEFEQIEAEEDDFLSLLDQMAPDDPVTADVKAISDLLQGKPADEADQSNSPSDVGEVFSDALKAVSSLHDPDSEVEELLDKIPDPKEKKKKQKKQKKQKEQKEQESEPKKPKQKKSKKQRQDDPAEAPQDQAEEEKPKKGLLKKLFGNVPDENSKKKKSKGSFSNESAAAKDTVKKGKAAKRKKGAASEDSEDEEAFPGGKGKARAAGEKGEDKKEGKKEKKEKKKKAKEIIQVIDEIEEDEGRINRLGASIVFLFFGLLVALLLVGTNVVSYTLSIQHATNYFDKQKYNEAYNEVYGIDIKAEDIVIYDKIMTVMFVNKQLNSYNSYYSLEEYPEALDSLLKGLKRYDKYIEFATIIGIKTDLDYVRGQILAELKNVFNLSEKDAVKIISMDNKEDYSSEVYHVVLEKMNN